MNKEFVLANKEVILTVANNILSKYNMLLRYARYDIHGSEEAELIVKDSKKECNIGTIKMQKGKLLKFYVGEINFYSSDYDLANKYRDTLMQLYKDIDKLNVLSQLLQEEE